MSLDYQASHEVRSEGNCFLSSLHYSLSGPSCKCNGDVLAPLKRRFNTGTRGAPSVALAGQPDP